jgi:hypothetical protein
MSRVLVVADNFAARTSHIIRVLETLGIEGVPALLIGSTLQVQGGSYPANSTAARDFLNSFDAVFVVESRNITATANALDHALNSWLQWNTAADKPIVYFGVNFSTARTSLSLPADFPLIRPNAADLTNTVAAHDAGTFTKPSDLPAGGGIYTRLGAEVYFYREGATLFLPTACAFEGTNPYFWRYDTAKHAALGSAGEVLAIPNFGDRTFPTNTVIAYRYKNRYFLPIVLENLMRMVEAGISWVITLFWVLYGLKLCGVAPKRRAVLCIEIDHTLQTKTGRLDGKTELEQLQIEYATLQWLRDFCLETGLVVPCTITNGRNRSLGYYYGLVNHPNPSIRSIARAANQFWVSEHSRALPCGIHDHTYTYHVVTGNFTRAGDNRHPYAAPNDVPIEHGTVIARSVAPAGLSGAMEWGDWYEVGYTTSGTGQTVSTRNESFHTARMVLSDNIDEVRELGFPDGHCGRHRYTNCAANATGGKGYWEAMIEVGFRGVRAIGFAPYSNYTQVYSGVLRGNRYKTLWFVQSRDLDWSVGDAQGAYGLWRSDTTQTAVGVWRLEVGTDISSDYATNEGTRWKAFRRVQACHIGIWLTMALVFRGTVYVHPLTWLGASSTNPTARVDTGSDLLVNPMVELLSAMREVVHVVSDYLRFGSPSDVMDLLEEVQG